jgi:hypothetical protein
MSVLSALVVVWLVRKGLRLARYLLVAAGLVAAWPVTAVSAVAVAGAWLRGWPPARLYRAALRSVPMAGVYLVAAATRAGSWQAVALAPVRGWEQASGMLAHGRIVQAVLGIAPVAVPAGLAAGGAAWARRIWAIGAGLAGRSAFAPAAFDARQWRRQVSAARGALAAPGLVPLATSSGMVPVGPVIRTVGRRWSPVLAVPAAAFARHMVIVGSSGSGKTNLMIRLWAGWYAVTLAAARRGQPRPLLAALDCKGGPDGRAKANRARRVLYGVGARRVAIWPDEATLSLWDLPPRDLAVLLHQLTEHGTGGAAYYADIIQAVLTLAVCAPGPPPAGSAQFLDRLDAGWLETAYADGRPNELGWIHAARPHLGDIQLRYATLPARLGPALDGPGRLADADAWYFILEGTREPSVAEAQAMAITEHHRPVLPRPRIHPRPRATARRPAARYRRPGRRRPRHRHRRPQGRIKKLDTAQAAQIKALEQIPDSPAAAAIRARIMDRFAELHDQRKTAETQLIALTTSQPVAADPAILDEIPYAGDILPTLPPQLKARLPPSTCTSCGTNPATKPPSTSKSPTPPSRPCQPSSTPTKTATTTPGHLKLPTPLIPRRPWGH